ncbi:MAG: hypothetical protein KJ607_13020 [Bacteroidetes bacterium]|nr:hypothetical protein [Bacteroidota bacterium]
MRIKFDTTERNINNPAFVQLTGIMSKLFKAYENPDNIQEIRQILDKLKSLSFFCFNSEKDITVRKNERHEQFISRIDEFREMLDNGDELVPYDIMDFIVSCLAGQDSDEKKIA